MMDDDARLDDRTLSDGNILANADVIPDSDIIDRNRLLRWMAGTDLGYHQTQRTCKPQTGIAANQCRTILWKLFGKGWGGDVGISLGAPEIVLSHLSSALAARGALVSNRRSPRWHIWVSRAGLEVA